MRLVYGMGVALAAWVAGWGLFAPDQIDRAVPWILPPLHARFVGALYLSGAVYMLGMLLSRRWSRQAVVAPMIVIWTGVLFAVLLWRLDTVEEMGATVIVWLVAYAVLPVTETVRLWRHRADRADRADRGTGDGDRVAPWLRGALWIQGVLVTTLAAAMLLAPGVVAAGWPWPAPPLAIQIYAGPLMAYGVGSILGARRRAMDDLALLAPGLAVFGSATVIISIGNIDSFEAGPATWLWFTVPTIISVLFGLLSLRSFVDSKVAT